MAPTDKSTKETVVVDFQKKKAPRDLQKKDAKLKEMREAFKKALPLDPAKKPRKKKKRKKK